jgi:hypothetical protein
MSIFPASWDPTQAVKKRRKTFAEENEAHATHSLPPVAFQSDLLQSILRRLNAPDPAPGPPQAQIQLDHVLSRVPYRAMLENLFQSAADGQEEEDAQTEDVPILTRAYEESFMRQPLPGERACAMRDLCECMHIDKANPFVGVEMRLPNDPEEPQMCVLCSRSTTQKCFYDICFLGRSVSGVIQRYGCIYGQPGEYAAECMLIPTRALGIANMPVPCMSHQRNRYSVVTHGGIKHLKQHRVGHEDFHHPSSTGAA